VFHHDIVICLQVSLKKDKIVRHFKWHKKRDDSLQQGFLRFSPLEDCSKKCAPNCSHNGRNTHYHCIQVGRLHWLLTGLSTCCSLHLCYLYHTPICPAMDSRSSCSTSCACNFTACPYCHLSNHIHCIRSGKTTFKWPSFMMNPSENHS